MNKVPDNVGFIFWREKEKKKKKKKKGLLWREWEGNEELFWKDKHKGLVLGFCSLHFACMHRTNPNTLTYVDGECAPPLRTVVYFLKHNFKRAFNLIGFLFFIFKKKNYEKLSFCVGRNG
jgi:hypothetical protein